MKRLHCVTCCSTWSWLVVLVAFSLANGSPAHAAFTTTGDVIPEDPATWTSGTTGYIGNTADGTLTVDDGSDLVSQSGYVGYMAGVSGLVRIDGAGSTWTASGSLSVGFSGGGALQITNGGAVSGHDGYVGCYNASSGTVAVDGAGSAWTNSSTLEIGYSRAGTLKISNGGAVSDINGYVGNLGSGEATVDGAGSTWTNSNGLIVSYYESATVTITNGGAVSAPWGYIGYYNSGTVTVDGVGSTWTGGTLNVGFSGRGTLNVTNGGTVNSSHGYIDYGNSYSAPPSLATVDGVGSTWTNSGILYIGDSGAGMLSITNGGAVYDSNGYIGYDGRAGGTVTVSGAGSTWANEDTLRVGYYSATGAILRITDGGVVTDSTGYIGYYGASSGTATVNGAGSTWANSGALCVGNSGAGTLAVVGGGRVTASSVSVNSTSLLAIDVGRNSALTVASGGTITNNGKIRILAGAGVPVNDSIKYSPISVGTWGGTGTYQAVGGTWDAIGHKFTASTVAAGTSGSAVSLNLAAVQRTLVDDPATGWTVGASFVKAPSTKNITFNATVADGTAIDALETAAGSGQEILNAWTFSTTNYAVSSSNPIYFSFDVGAGRSADELELWHYDGSEWTSYTPLDLTYDGRYASFTATGLSGYAMTAVPEPGMLAMLGVAALGWAGWGWSRRKSRGR
jgi:T5SS/PEP-CTERM-associated repeat protein